MKNQKKSKWIIGLLFFIGFVIFLSAFNAGLKDGRDDKNKEEIKQIQKTEAEKVK